MDAGDQRSPTKCKRIIDTTANRPSNSDNHDGGCNRPGHRDVPVPFCHDLKGEHLHDGGNDTSHPTA